MAGGESEASCGGVSRQCASRCSTLSFVIFGLDPKTQRSRNIVWVLGSLRVRE